MFICKIMHTGAQVLTKYTKHNQLFILKIPNKTSFLLYSNTKNITGHLVLLLFINPSNCITIKLNMSQIVLAAANNKNPLQ